MADILNDTSNSDHSEEIVLMSDRRHRTNNNVLSFRQMLSSSSPTQAFIDDFWKRQAAVLEQQSA